MTQPIPSWLLSDFYTWRANGNFLYDSTQEFETDAEQAGTFVLFMDTLLANPEDLCRAVCNFENAVNEKEFAVSQNRIFWAQIFIETARKIHDKARSCLASQQLTTIKLWANAEVIQGHQPSVEKIKELIEEKIKQFTHPCMRELFRSDYENAAGLSNT